MLKRIFMTSLAVLPGAIYIYHGFYKNYPIEQDEIPAQNFIYIQNNGGYKKLSDSFGKLAHDMKDFGDHAKEFAGFKWVGIYYDDPKIVTEEAKQRAIVGFFLDPASQNLANEFLKKNPEYALQEVPKINTISTSIPLKSPLTVLYNFAYTHPRLRKYIAEKELVENVSSLPIVEVYKVENQRMSDIAAHIPIGGNIDKIMLYKSPQPSA